MELIKQVIGGCELYNGDCLAVMDALIAQGVKVDMILTDPPYGMSYQSHRRKEMHNKIANDTELDWVEDFAEKCYNISNDNTAHYVFTSFHKIDIFKQAFEKFFTIKNILVWEKNNHTSGDLKGNFASKVEFVLFMHKGRKLMNGGRVPNIFKFAKTNNDLHPTQKPVDMLEFLADKFSNKDDIILDPFMGSASTGVACMNTNRRFIGIELDEGYYKISTERVQQAIDAKQNSLFSGLE